MLLLCLLLLSILLLSAGVARWLADTGVATASRYIYAVVIGSVLISVLYDVVIVAHLSRLIFVLSALIISVIVFVSQLGATLSSLAIPPLAPTLRTSLYTVIVFALIYYISYAFIPHSGRWGRWDARAIWTLHALFLNDPQYWRAQFSPAIPWSHADYPLLLSSLIAMCWRVIGYADALVPCVIAYLVCIAIPVISASGAKQKSGAFWGIVAMLVFALTSDYPRIAAFQGADTLLSLFILMPFVIMRQVEDGGDAKLLFLAGVFAGFAGWAKNEGIAFLIVFSLGMLWRYRASPRSFLPYAYGLILPVCIILIFKIGYAPANDIVHGQGHSTLSKLADLHRYQLTAKTFVDNMWLCYPVLLCVFALVILRGYKRLLDLHLLLLIVMIVVYYFIFIITPRDLAWHLETASERLFMQLFPALAFVLVSVLSEDDTSSSSIAV